MHLLIAAAGSGRRMGADRNKLLLPVAGRPLLAWTLAAAVASRHVRWIGVIGQPCDRAAVTALCTASGSAVPIRWIEGGASRQASVCRGLAALPAEADHVLVHDGARCLVEPQLLDRCAAAVRRHDQAGGDPCAVIAATPVTDTIKQVEDGGIVVATPDRSRLWAAQTPQAFPVAPLRQAHQWATSRQLAVTDDAALFEARNWRVVVEPGSPGNLKITTRFDLELAGVLLQQRHHRGVHRS